MLQFLWSCSYLFTFLPSFQFYWCIRLNQQLTFLSHPVHQSKVLYHGRLPVSLAKHSSGWDWWLCSRTARWSHWRYTALSLSHRFVIFFHRHCSTPQHLMNIVHWHWWHCNADNSHQWVTERVSEQGLTLYRAEMSTGHTWPSRSNLHVNFDIRALCQIFKM